MESDEAKINQNKQKEETFQKEASTEPPFLKLTRQYSSIMSTPHLDQVYCCRDIVCSHGNP